MSKAMAGISRGGVAGSHTNNSVFHCIRYELRLDTTAVARHEKRSILGRQSQGKETTKPENGATTATGRREMYPMTLASLVRLRVPNFDDRELNRMAARAGLVNLDVTDVQGGEF